MKADQLRAIFFDAGNTLIHPRVEELARDLTEQGHRATSEDFWAAERAGKGKLDGWLWGQLRQGKFPSAVDRYYWREYLRALMDRLHAPEDKRAHLMRQVGERFGDITLWSEVMPGTAPFLAALRAGGYYLGVISNSNGTIEEQLRRVGLAKHFDAVLDSANVGVEKPHPEIFQMAMRRAGVGPPESLFVGDTYAIDVGGAQLAGLRGVLIDRVGAYPQATCPRITALPELKQFLET